MSLKPAYRPNPAHIQAFLGAPVAMHPRALQSMLAMLRSEDAVRASIQAADWSRIDARAKALKASAFIDPLSGWFDESFDAHIIDGIAIIPVYGATMLRSSWCYSGYDHIERAIAEAVQRRDVQAILLRIESPGGDARVHDICSMIRDAREVKPVIGYSATEALSAGCALSSSCSQFFIGRQAEVGFMGVYTAHEDVSRMLEYAGVDVKYYASSDDKLAFVSDRPRQPVTDETFTKMVADSYGLYVDAIAAGRSLDPELIRSTGAKIFFGPEAFEIGLADKAETPDGTISYWDLLANITTILRGMP